MKKIASREEGSDLMTPCTIPQMNNLLVTSKNKSA